MLLTINPKQNLIVAFLVEVDVTVEDFDEELHLDGLVHALVGNAQRLFEAFCHALSILYMKTMWCDVLKKSYRNREQQYRKKTFSRIKKTISTHNDDDDDDDDDDELDDLYSTILWKLHLKGALQRLYTGYIKQVCF